MVGTGEGSGVSMRIQERYHTRIIIPSASLTGGTPMHQAERIECGFSSCPTDRNQTALLPRRCSPPEHQRVPEGSARTMLPSEWAASSENHTARWNRMRQGKGHEHEDGEWNARDGRHDGNLLARYHTAYQRTPAAGCMRTKRDGQWWTPYGDFHTAEAATLAAFVATNLGGCGLGRAVSTSGRCAVARCSTTMMPQRLEDSGRG